MIKDGALGLLADLGQPDDALAPTGRSFPHESFDVPLLVYLKTSHCSCKHNQLSLASLFVNFSIFHRISVIFSLHSLVHEDLSKLTLAGL
jgi:hypothetical protein